MWMSNTKCCGWPHWKNVALLVLRITVGLVLAYHGWTKLGNIAGTSQFMGNVVGLPGGGFWAWFVGLVEFIGGLMLIVGLYARLAAKVLAIDILFALLLVHTKAPWAQAELPLVLFGGLLALSACGAGCWRLSKAQCICEKKMGGKKMCGCAMGECKCGHKKEDNHCEPGGCH